MLLAQCSVFGVYNITHVMLLAACGVIGVTLSKKGGPTRCALILLAQRGV